MSELGAPAGVLLQKVDRWPGHPWSGNLLSLHNSLSHLYPQIHFLLEIETNTFEEILVTYANLFTLIKQ